MTSQMLTFRRFHGTYVQSSQLLFSSPGWWLNGYDSKPSLWTMDFWSWLEDVSTVKAVNSRLEISNQFGNIPVFQIVADLAITDGVIT